jgi:Bacterial Ig-like domain (group 2).
LDTFTKHIVAYLAPDFRRWREFGFIRIFFVFVLFIFICQRTTAQSQTFSSSGTFIAPAGVTSVSVQCWGAGGGGGGSATNKSGGGGGGGGAFTVNNSVSVTPGTSYTITVGSGGTGGIGNLSGGTGGSTSANLGITVTANGGSGGNAPSSSTGGNGGAAGSFSGGKGANGQTATNNASGGGGGSSAGTGSIGNNGSGTTGGTAVTGGGAGSNGGTSGAAGSAGSAPGGGGGGGGQNASGGKGADGKVVITYTCPTYSLSGASTSPVCAGNQATVNLTSTAANLPVGNYTVTYNLGSPNTAFGLTATMNVTTAGTGSFTIPGTALATSGTTSITITTLSSGTNCISSISGISTNLTVNSSSSITAPSFVCVGSTGYLTPSSGVTWTSSNSAVATVTNAGVITGVSSGNVTFTYTDLSSGCSKTSSSVSINTAATITLISAANTNSQTICSGAITPIMYNISGATGATVTGLPSGVTYNYNSGLLIISGVPAVSGTFNYTVTLTGTSCGTTTVLGTIYVVSSIDPGNIDAVRSGGRCGVNIVGSTNVTCPDGTPATYYWEYKLNGTSTWVLVPDSSRADLYPSNSDFTRAKYRRTAVCGSCTSAAANLNSPITSYMGVTVTTTNVKCFNANDGTATATISGGTSPFTYTWSPTTPTQTTATATGLAPGTYSVNVKDAYNCNTNTSATITGPASALTASIAGYTNVTCYGSATGTITVIASGGWGGYSYSADGTTYQSGNVLSGLVAGTYTVRVKDANNCIYTLPSVTISQPTSAITATLTSTNVPCNGASDGTITISAPTGGYGTYEYTINGGTTWLSSGSFTGLTNTTYNVQIRDAGLHACPTILNSSLSITQPAALSATVASTNVTCYGANDGTITISVPTGGYGTYEYTINGGTNWQGSGSFTGLTNTTYNVQIGDAAHTGCIKILNSGLTITQPAQLSITSQPLPQTDCYGNQVEFSVTVSGGVGTITYQWQQKPPSGTFTDISGANAALLSINNIGMYSQNIDGTEYRVLITDNCGTIVSNSAILHVNAITDLQPASGTSTICYGGNFSYSVSTQGTVVSYQWSFNNGSGWVDLTNNAIYSGVTSSQLVISNATTAQSGAYRVSVTFTTLNQPVGYPTCVEVSSSRPRNLVVRAQLTAPQMPADYAVCYNKIPLSISPSAATGGSGPYHYQWQSSPDGTNWTDITGETNLGYAPGALTTSTYYRIFTTDLGTPSCGSVYSSAVKITVNPLPTPTLTSSDPDNLICEGQSLTFTASGGSNYNFRVDGTSMQNSSSNTYVTTSITNGQTVDVVATSAEGCEATNAGIKTTVVPYPGPNPIVTN